MGDISIAYFSHYTRLVDIHKIVAFGCYAAEETQERKNPLIEDTFKVMASKFEELLDFVQPTSDESERKKITKDLFEQYQASFRMDLITKHLLINLSLVMLCTELEVFIGHLIDRVLTKDPRMLKSVASKKHLSASDIVDLKTSEAIFQALRDKVVKEITDCNARDMFLSQLGERFQLIEECDFQTQKIKSLEQNGFFGFSKVEEIFRFRHEIVHRGTLLLNDADYIGNTVGMFQVLQYHMTRRAISKYGLILDSGESEAIFRLYSQKFDPQ